MSPDFMVSYLAVGPLRARLNRTTEARLPISVADLGSAEAMPEDLIKGADMLRRELHGKDDRVVRRYLRDRLDKHRRRVGPHAKGGIALAQAQLAAEIGDQA
jgi:hypothetical protein